MTTPGQTESMPKTLATAFMLVDIGFIAYWAITLAGVIPESYLFKDYHNPILAAWNWSFLPLDLLISATGLTSVVLARRGRAWERWALSSLLLTFCSGLQAIAFWVLRADFDPSWWAANGFLLLYPLAYIPRLLRSP